MATKKKRGRPKKVKKVIEELAEEITSPEEPITLIDEPSGEGVSGRCACGEPLAEGQNAVCKKHIKAN